MTDRENGLTHFDEAGRPVMVDVSNKPETARVAVAEALVRMRAETRQRIEAEAIAKGDVRAVSELAGIMAAKRTSELIPLCHPLPLSSVHVQTEWVDDAPPGPAFADSRLRIVATVKTTYRTGVEMEALTACSIAALTVYDMCKAVDRNMSIESVRLIHKSGGKSGTFDA
ncbi:MAG: cyclic pyranopterin monophosphate synthase MoaC [Alicyclobacillus sp.]|nr:cyclic pyranopterin monophosphate synthase MoaC [Alicyclobacillus sp.]